jgi:hypothetical protein
MILSRSAAAFTEGVHMVRESSTDNADEAAYNAQKLDVRLQKIESNINVVGERVTKLEEHFSDKFESFERRSNDLNTAVIGALGDVREMSGKMSSIVDITAKREKMDAEAAERREATMADYNKTALVERAKTRRSAINIAAPLTVAVAGFIAALLAKC